MQTSLDVINDMLGSMGQRPVNSIDSTNRWVGIALGILNRTKDNTLAVGWWFNTERAVLVPSAQDSRIYLPNDYLGIVRGEQSRYVMRGRQLFDTYEGTDLFTSEVEVEIVRSLPFEDVPHIVAAYIAAAAVLRFQRDYDGDSTKTSFLSREYEAARVLARSEDIRNRRVNMHAAVPRLQYIQRMVRGYRSWK